MYGVKITGLGIYLPSTILTNDEVAKILSRNRDLLLQQHVNLTPEQLEAFDTSDEWITERIGIKERRIADPQEATSDLAARAAQRALRHSGLNPDKVQFISLGTVSPDYLYSPPTSAIVQQKLGLKPGTATFDVNVACSSFIYALELGYSQIRSGQFSKGIVIGADIMTRTVNWNDRGFSPILGDGAGALVLEAVPLAQDCFVENGFLLGADGNYKDLIIAPTGGSKQPLTKELLSDPLSQPHKLWMNGREVFKKMVIMVPQIMDQALKKAGLTIEQIDLMVFHQANLRIIQAVVPRLQKNGLRPDTIVYNNIERVGNTTSASIPLCWYGAWQEELLKPGMLVMAMVFGGGFTWGITILRWPVLPETTE